MAIPCGACEQPVDDHAVICPHCGEPTGIAPDPTLSTAEIAAFLATRELPRVVDPARVQVEAMAHLAESPVIAGVVSAAAAVGAAVGAVVDTLFDARDKPGLPPATAHVRRRHVTPLPSAEPERAEPPDEGEEPRFLK